MFLKNGIVNFDFLIFLAFKKTKEPERLVILKNKYADGLFRDYDRTQVEQKFGGDIKDLKSFW